MNRSSSPSSVLIRSMKSSRFMSTRRPNFSDVELELEPVNQDSQDTASGNTSLQASQDNDWDDDWIDDDELGDEID